MSRKLAAKGSMTTKTIKRPLKSNARGLKKHSCKRCKAPFEGRRNKLYCSDRCRWYAKSIRYWTKRVKGG